MIAPLQLKSQLEEYGYYCDDNLVTDLSLFLAQESSMIKSMILDGPPGAGKTFLAKSIAKVLHCPYIYIQAHAGSTSEDFLFDANIVTILRSAAGDKTAVKGPRDVISLGFLPTLYQMSQSNFVVGFVEELDKASPKIDAFFLTALQEAEVMIKGIEHPLKANNKNLLLFFTKNNEREVNEALMRRCRRHYLSFPNKQLELQILLNENIPNALANILIDLANKIRDKHEDYIKVPATQELIMAGKDILKLSSWNLLSQSGPVASRWLAAYKEDALLFTRIIDIPNLTNQLKSACRVEITNINKINLQKSSNDFIKFGQ